MQIEVETKNGLYVLWKPKGKVGVKYMGLLLRFYREMDKAKKLGIEGLFEVEEVVNIFEEWCDKILPHIIYKSPFKYEDIPYSDMLVLFTKCIENAAEELAEEVTDESFQEG